MHEEISQDLKKNPLKGLNGIVHGTHIRLGTVPASPGRLEKSIIHG